MFSLYGVAVMPRPVAPQRQVVMLCATPLCDRITTLSSWAQARSCSVLNAPSRADTMYFAESTFFVHIKISDSRGSKIRVDQVPTMSN